MTQPIPPTLDAHLAGDDLRHFFKVLQTLHKIGSDLFIEATPTRFHIATLNDHKSAFAIANFSPIFFSKYSLTQDTLSVDPPGKEPTLQCCLPLAPLIAIFKGKAPASSSSSASSGSKSSPMLPSQTAAATTAVGNPLPSTASHTRGSARSTAPSTHACRLLTTPTSLTLRFHASASDSTSHKSFTLHLTNTGAHPRPVYTKAACPHLWSVRPEHLAAIAVHFHPRIDDIVLRCERDRVVWKTVAPDVTDTGDAPGALETTVEMAVEDLEPYLVQVPDTPVAASSSAGQPPPPPPPTPAAAVEVCFGWREFKAALALAETIGEPVTAHFSGPGGAIIFALEKPDLYLMDIVLATVQQDAMPTAGPAPAAPARSPMSRAPGAPHAPAPASVPRAHDPFAFPAPRARAHSPLGAASLTTIPPLSTAQLAQLRGPRTVPGSAAAPAPMAVDARAAPAAPPSVDGRAAAFPFTTPRSPAGPVAGAPGHAGAARLPTLGNSFGPAHHDSLSTAAAGTPEVGRGSAAVPRDGAWDAPWARPGTPSASDGSEEEDDDDGHVPPTPPAAKRARLMF